MSKAQAPPKKKKFGFLCWSKRDTDAAVTIVDNGRGVSGRDRPRPTDNNNNNNTTTNSNSNSNNNGSGTVAGNKKNTCSGKAEGSAARDLSDADLSLSSEEEEEESASEPEGPVSPRETEKPTDTVVVGGEEDTEEKETEEEKRIRERKERHAREDAAFERAKARAKERRAREAAEREAKAKRDAENAKNAQNAESAESDKGDKGDKGAAGTGSTAAATTSVTAALGTAAGKSSPPPPPPPAVPEKKKDAKHEVPPASPAAEPSSPPGAAANTEKGSEKDDGNNDRDSTENDKGVDHQEPASHASFAEQMEQGNRSIREKLGLLLDSGKNYVKFGVELDLFKGSEWIEEGSSDWVTTREPIKMGLLQETRRRAMHESMTIFLEPNDEPELVEVRDDGNKADNSYNVDPSAYDRVRFRVWMLRKPDLDVVATFERTREQLIELTKVNDHDEWGTGSRIDVPKNRGEDEDSYLDTDDGDGWVTLFFYPNFKQGDGEVYDVFKDVSYTVAFDTIAHLVDLHEDVEGWQRLVRRGEAE